MAKKLMSALAILSLFGAVQGFAAETANQPKSGQEAPQKLRIEQAPVNSLKGEVSCIKEFIGSTLIRTTTKYTNDDIKVEEFNSDGTAHGIVQMQNGELKTTLFTADGKGIKTITSIVKDKVTTEEYRPDGKTLWTRKTSDSVSRQAEYYGPDGKLRLRRTNAKAGQMAVQVFDSNGVELYSQQWVPGFAGYVLVEIREKNATGDRVIKWLGRKVDSADYYRKDGTLEKTEPGDKLSTPFDTKRAQELDPADDPTVPKSPRPRQ